MSLLMLYGIFNGSLYNFHEVYATFISERSSNLASLQYVSMENWICTWLQPFSKLTPAILQASTHYCTGFLDAIETL